MNTNHQDTSRDCWILSANSLFVEVLGVGLTGNAVFRSCQNVHPAHLKDQIFKAKQEPDCLILDGDSFVGPSELARVFDVLDSYLPDSNMIAFCESEKWPLLSDAIQSGVRGIVLKSQGIEEIREIVEAVLDGNASCGAGIAAEALSQIRKLAAQKVCETNLNCSLTKRELEVLEYVANGSANKEISRALGLSISTVKNHLHNIFEKLECHSRQTAVRNAIAFGFLKCSKDKVFA